MADRGIYILQVSPKCVSLQLIITNTNNKNENENNKLFKFRHKCY